MGDGLVELGPGDLDTIMAVERAAFDPEIQADPDTVLHRFALGHQMRGVTHGGELSGTIGFSTIELADEDFDRLPATFKEYSTQSVPADADTVCIYSLGIVPRARGVRAARLLIASAFEHGRSRGFRGVIADGPIPSFAGNEQVVARPEVGDMIRRFVETGVLPSHDDFLQDPLLALYNRLTGCSFVKLLADFLPEDKASGGWRVVLHRRLEVWSA